MILIISSMEDHVKYRHPLLPGHREQLEPRSLLNGGVEPLNTYGYVDQVQLTVPVTARMTVLVP